jgi:hypothetical protein
MPFLYLPQLPEAAKEFDKLDKTWLKIMTDTAKNTNAHDACLAEGRVGTLTEMSSALDKCQKSLTDYLETKRNAFPRFFFISDDELLSVLGTSDVTSIQEHMLKLFDNCAELIFARNNRVVKGMVSSEGESFEYRTVSSFVAPLPYTSKLSVQPITLLYEEEPSECRTVSLLLCPLECMFYLHTFLYDYTWHKHARPRTA